MHWIQFYGANKGKKRYHGSQWAGTLLRSISLRVFLIVWFSFFKGHGKQLKAGIKMRAGFSYVQFTDSINPMHHATVMAVQYFQAARSVQVL